MDNTSAERTEFVEENAVAMVHRLEAQVQRQREELGRLNRRACFHAQHHQPITTTYACQRCGRRDGLDAVCPNEQWAKIIDGTVSPGGEVEDGKWNLLCLWCIDELAAAKGMAFSVSLHFCGKAVHGTSQSDADADHVRRLVEQIDRLQGTEKR